MAPANPSLEPILKMIGELTARIRAYDQEIERMCTGEYPETLALRQISGVGAITALTFVLTLEDPARFRDGRAVGPYLGLCPRRRQSGGSDPQLRITKTGDRLLRRLLVGAADRCHGSPTPPAPVKRFLPFGPG